MPRAIDAIYLDLDGTALDRKSTLLPTTIEAVATARARGVRVGVATGRRRTSVVDFAKVLGVDAPCVLFNGAQVVDLHDGTMHHSAALDAGVVAEAIELGIAHGAAVCAYFGEHLVVDDRVPLVFPRSGSGSRTPLFQPEVASLPALLATRDEPVIKLLFSDTPERLAALAEVLAAVTTMSRASLVRSAQRFLELLPPGASKGAGFRRAVELLGVPLARVAAFGDEHNDVEMLELAGVGVAMDNAVDACKQVARHVIGDNDSGALGAFILALLDDDAADDADRTRLR